MKKTIGNSGQLEQWLEAEFKSHPPPPDGVTAHQYAQMRNLGLCVARRRLNKMVEEGLATRGWYAMSQSGGRNFIYQLKK